MRSASAILLCAAAVAACAPADSAPAPRRVVTHVASAAGQVVAAEEPAAIVRRIRAHYTTIERELGEYRCRTLPLEGFSAEGGELRACFAGDQLRKLDATHFGEGGRTEEQLYFWNGELEFVFRVGERYTAPLSGQIAERTEDRLYFAGDRLVRWLGAGNEPRATTGAEAGARAARERRAAEALAACARDRARTRCEAGAGNA